MPHQLYLISIPLLPLTAFIILGLFGRRLPVRSAAFIATACILLAAIFAIASGIQYFLPAGKIDGAYPSLVFYKVPWLSFTPQLSIDMGLLVDPISMMMMMVITFVSLMVHVFSMSYMKDEERQPAYYAFLGLFTFSMLGLVVASNLFQTYMFWELVGLSSYLLIGFYFERPAAVAAAKKAFIVTRFADLGFLLGILILAFNGQTLDITELIHRLGDPSSSWTVLASGTSFLGISVLTWALLLVFAGGAGKSAMFPFHVWLPDAMEGPTPVSALIHAATMVVAGVYLVARLFPVFSMSTTALSVVAWVGAISAALAAIMACTQTDIKRVLAYSTMSQIGYMMFALGLSRYGTGSSSGYSASMFHLFTHAFFKSLLFLGAGAVIHFVHGNEMGQMGALRKKMPLTHICFLVACLAIAGIPPFSGFFSKEEILAAAYAGNRWIYAIGLVVSGLTAFYMFRLYFSIFWNDGPRAEHAAINPHAPQRGDGSLAMQLPLLLLATLTIISGFLPFHEFVNANDSEPGSALQLSSVAPPVLLAVCGILLAAFFYWRQSDRATKLSSRMRILYKASLQRFYIDDLYLFITRNIIINGVGRAAAWIDKNVVDGLVNASASASFALSRFIKKFQSGHIQDYAMYFFAGIAVLAALSLYFFK